MKKQLVFLFFISIGFANAQSPWTREKGKVYAQLGVSGLFYNTAQIDGQKTNLAGDYSDVTTQIYSEYGISNEIEALVILPLKVAGFKSNSGNTTEQLSGLGNITLGLKYKFYDQKLKISTGLQLQANTSKYDLNTGLSTDFNATSLIPYFTIGSSNGKWYYFGNIGYGYMTNDFSDYLKIGAELGYLVLPKGHLILALDSKNPIAKESAFLNNESKWPSYLDRQTYNAVGVKFNYEFNANKYGANIGAFGAFGNNNAPLAPTINLAVYAKL
jgi:hypothetical protein